MPTSNDTQPYEFERWHTVSEIIVAYAEGLAIAS